MTTFILKVLLGNCITYTNFGILGLSGEGNGSQLVAALLIVTARMAQFEPAPPR